MVANRKSLSHAQNQTPVVQATSVTLQTQRYRELCRNTYSPNSQELLKSPSTIHATASKGQYPLHSIVDRDERFARWFTTSLKPYFSLIDPSHVSTFKCSIIHLVPTTKRNFKRILHLDRLNLSYSLEYCITEVRWVYVHYICQWTLGRQSLL